MTDSIEIDSQALVPLHIKELTKRRINADMADVFGKKREYLIKYQGHSGYLYNVGSGGDLIMLYGHEGTRKTQLIDAISASLFIDDPKKTLGFWAHPKLKEKAVLHIDTEQSEEDTYFGRHKFYESIGIEKLKGHPRYHSYNLKPYSPDQMIDQISHLVHQIKEEHDQEIGLIVIDQIADMCKGGYNNEDGVITAVKAIERWTSITGALTLTVMHSNREGKKANGILGSRMDKKVAASFRLEISHQGGITTVNPEKARKSGELPRFTFDQSRHAPHHVRLLDIREAPGMRKDGNVYDDVAGKPAPGSDVEFSE